MTNHKAIAQRLIEMRAQAQDQDEPNATKTFDNRRGRISDAEVIRQEYIDRGETPPRVISIPDKSRSALNRLLSHNPVFDNGKKQGTGWGK